jgi:GNAT superfamily N-acetyltransferase
LGERVVGFVGAFPDLRQAFLQASGSGGIADIDFLRDVVDRVQEGFVAWMAVDPDVMDRGVGRQLLTRLYEEMLKRNYREALLSWEMIDGHRTSQSFYPSEKAIIERLD